MHLGWIAAAAMFTRQERSLAHTLPQPWPVDGSPQKGKRIDSRLNQYLIKTEGNIGVKSNSLAPAILR